MLRNIWYTLADSFMALLPAFSATAFEWPGATSGHPLPWQLGLQLPASPVMEMLYTMHDGLMILITVISVFVLALLGWVCWRYSEKRNPTPSKTTHNSLIEIIWTSVPVLILVVVAIPSLKALYYSDKAEKADMTIKVVGYQWYWQYEYPDHGGFKFDSYLKQDADLQPGEIRLLEVDNRIVVPVDATVRVLLTAADVNHNFAMPALGLKKDAIPGKLNETWFRATKEGVYRGQCSELCGVRHGFMPIVIEVVSKDRFDTWVEEAKTKFAANDNAATDIATALAQ